MDTDSILLDAEERMEKALAALDRDFAKLRTGRASTALVEGIKADYYGTPHAHRPDGLCGRARQPHPDHPALGQRWHSRGGKGHSEV